jgi:hypothetical protein
MQSSAPQESHPEWDVILSASMKNNAADIELLITECGVSPDHCNRKFRLNEETEWLMNSFLACLANLRALLIDITESCNNRPLRSRSNSNSYCCTVS